MDNFGDSVIKVNNEVRIDCDTCGEHLLRCISIVSDHLPEKENNLKSQYIVHCNKCNGKNIPSRVLTGRGHVFPYYEELSLEFIDSDIKDNVIINTLKVVSR